MHTSYLDVPSKMAIFRHFIISNFSYCPLVWHFCGKTNSDKMEKIQERGLRFVFNDFDSNYEDLLKKAGLTTLFVSRLKTLAVEMYKAVNDETPPYISSLFSFKSKNYNLRGKNKLELPRFNSYIWKTVSSIFWPKTVE